MGARGLTLARPEVQAAREKFEKRHREEGCWTFDQYLEAFQSAEVSFLSIAKMAGKSHQAVAQMYARNFRRLLGGLTGRGRRQIAVKKNRAARRNEQLRALQASTRERNRYFARLAASCGFRLHFTSTLEGRRIVRVNGKRCLLLWTRYVFAPDSPRHAIYYRRDVAKKVLEKVAYVIVHGSAPGYPSRTFIIPSEILQSRFKSGIKRWGFYFPIERGKALYNNCRPEIDFWPFEDAWYSLA